MYAIISDSGQQFKVEEGQQLDIDYRDTPKGEKVTFDQVLVYSGDDGVRIGKPTLDGAQVTATVQGAIFDKKIVIQKVRRRKDSRLKKGHRQLLTRVQVEKISV